jgi:repressor LexA
VTGIGLTPRQADMLALITRYIAERGWAPTYREAMAELGINSTSGIHRLVEALIERGRIRWEWGQLALIQPLAKPQLRVVFGPGHFEDRARINRARYALENRAA